MANYFNSVLLNVSPNNLDRPQQELPGRFSYKDCNEEPLARLGNKELFPTVIPDMQISLTVDGEDTLCPSFMGSEISLLEGRGWEVCDMLECDASPAGQEPQLGDSCGYCKASPIPQKRQVFTKRQDKNLKELVRTYGESSWKEVANKMERRNAKQTKSIYNNFLKKRKNIYAFSEGEDALMLNEECNNGKLKDKTSKAGRKRNYSKLRNEEPLNLIADAANRGGYGKASDEPSKLKRMLTEEMANGNIPKENLLRQSMEILKEQSRKLSAGLGKISIMLDKLKIEGK
eukprot:TRINITY_DN13173_c0_g1_i3.p1 TRINITY_DN13173_c0_g1~~TRINITY_DN13173_c0_g1_i3.p1  ORF type:complete len:288 (-),score=59.54 TRINITY_DN13173_c0_g1_i3:129-992(-)